MNRRNFWKRATFGLLALFAPEQVHATHAERVLLVSQLDVRGRPYGNAEVTDTETGFSGRVDVCDDDGMHGYMAVVSGSETVPLKPRSLSRPWNWSAD